MFRVRKNILTLHLARSQNRLVMLALVCTLSACAQAPQPPTDAALQAAEMAISYADRNRVTGYSSPELIEARKKLNDARAAVHEKEMTVALRLAEESLVDAELAAANADVIKAQAVNTDMQRSIDMLKQESYRNSGEQQ